MKEGRTHLAHKAEPERPGSIQRHGVAEIFRAVGDSSAVETDEFGFFCERLDLIETRRAGQQADVSFVFSGTGMLAHGMLLCSNPFILFTL